MSTYTSLPDTDIGTPETVEGDGAQPTRLGIAFPLSTEEYDALKPVADYEGRTLSAQVQRFMQEALDLRQKSGAADAALKGVTRRQRASQRTAPVVGNRHR